MNRRSFMSLAIGITAVAALPAFASGNVLYTKAHWGEYARYVQSHTNVTVYANGTVNMNTKFSNGHRHDPQSMMVIVKLLDDNGRVVHSIAQDAHVQPSFGGRAREHVINRDYSMSAADAKRVVSSVSTHQRISARAIKEAEKLLTDYIKRGQKTGGGGSSTGRYLLQ